jgi:hypothetical protein
VANLEGRRRAPLSVNLDPNIGRVGDALVVDDDAAEAADGADNACAADPAITVLAFGSYTRTTDALVLWVLTLRDLRRNEEKRQDDQPTGSHPCNQGSSVSHVSASF